MLLDKTLHQAALLAEGLELFNKRARLEARLAALENLHDRLIEAAALHEINQQRGRDLARADNTPAGLLQREREEDHDSADF